jgi:hypothetical protein
VKVLKDVRISRLRNSRYRKSRGQEIGNLHGENPDFDLDRPSVETRGGDQEPIGISAIGVLI